MDEVGIVARAMKVWAEDPRRFVREALGAEPEAWQDEVLAQIARGRRRLAIRSGHGVGKTALQAWLVLWFGATREDAKIPATAPTSHQLVDLLWGEVVKWHRALAQRLPAIAAAIEVRADRIDFKPWRSTAYARTSRRDQSEALQGFHADNLLFLIDEAQHASVFVAGWRPFIGWVLGVGIGYSFLIAPILGGVIAIWKPGFAMPVVDEHLWELVFAMLGMGALRSFDKLRDTTASPSKRVK